MPARPAAAAAAAAGAGAGAVAGRAIRGGAAGGHGTAAAAPGASL